jgi:hypothetical protein
VDVWTEVEIPAAVQIVRDRLSGLSHDFASSLPDSLSLSPRLKGCTEGRMVEISLCIHLRSLTVENRLCFEVGLDCSRT